MKDIVERCRFIMPSSLNDAIRTMDDAGQEIERLRGVAQQRQELWACTGCGSQKTMEQIKSEHPDALSCCPERKMAPLVSSTHGEVKEATAAQHSDLAKGAHQK